MPVTRFFYNISNRLLNCSDQARLIHQLLATKFVLLVRCQEICRLTKSNLSSFMSKDSITVDLIFKVQTCLSLCQIS